VSPYLLYLASNLSLSKPQDKWVGFAKDSIKKDLARTPSEIIQELLSIEIQRLILLEKMSHKEISFYLNFDSASSYNRFVKKHFGCKPTEIIKSLKMHNY